MMQLSLEQNQISNQNWIEKIQYVPLYDYAKVYYHKSGIVLSGVAVLGQTLGKLIVIDIDNKVNSSIEEQKEKREELYQMFIPKDTSNVYIEQTGNLGFHIFLWNDLFDEEYLKQLQQNRFCEILKKQYKSDNFDIDVFVPSVPTEQCLIDVAKPHCDGLKFKDENVNEINLPNRSDKKTTRVRNRFKTVTSINIISQCDNFTSTSLTLSEYLEWVFQNTNINIKTHLINLFNEKRYVKSLELPKIKQKDVILKKQQFIRENIDKYGNTSMKDCANLIVQLLTDTEIHNYSGTDIKTEISLLPLFRSIMFLPEQYQEEIINQIYSKAALTINARKNYFTTWQKVKTTQQPFNDLSILATMIKYNNPNKFQEHEKECQDIFKKSLHPYDVNDLIKSRQNCIDFSEKISADVVFDELRFDQYYSIQDWFVDLQKVMIYNTKTRCFYEKLPEYQEYYSLSPLSLADLKNQFQDDEINGVSVITYLTKNRKYLNYHDIKVYSDDPNVFSVFKHFYYKPVQNDELIQLYLQHIKEIICCGDEKIYEFILNLFAFYIQHPVDRSGVVLVITGQQGNGKNTLTYPLHQLMGIYAKEVNDIDHVIGQFNPILEATHLLICNEVANYNTVNNSKLNYNKLKALITEPSIRINQKNENERYVDNMLNFIFLSNHSRPVIIEEGNRRYCVIKSGPKREQEYYDAIYNSFKQEGFYEALMYFLMTRDISKFRPQKDMPLTKETQDLIELNLDIIQLFVIKSQIVKSTTRTLYENYKIFIRQFGSTNQPIKDFNEFRFEMKKYYDEKRTAKKRWVQLKPQYIQEEHDEAYDYYQIEEKQDSDTFDNY